LEQPLGGGIRGRECPLPGLWLLLPDTLVARLEARPAGVRSTATRRRD